MTDEAADQNLLQNVERHASLPKPVIGVIRLRENLGKRNLANIGRDGDDRYQCLAPVEQRAQIGI